MKLKTLIFVCCIGLFSSAFAATHFHLQANNSAPREASKAPEAKSPGYCEIEILNFSSRPVRVFGVFDDGSVFSPFISEPYGGRDLISLYYYGYCHAAMRNIRIELLSGYTIVNQYEIPVHTTMMISDRDATTVKVTLATK